MMDKDPILEEIYQARRALSQAAGGDMAKIFAMLRDEQAASGKKPVSPKRKRKRPAAETTAGK